MELGESAEEPALLESYQEMRNSTPAMVKVNRPGKPKPGLFKKGDEMKSKHRRVHQSVIVRTVVKPYSCTRGSRWPGTLVHAGRLK
jgi:hypothetical protein